MAETAGTPGGRLAYFIETLRRLPPAMYGFVLAGSWVTWTRVGQGVPVSLPWPFGATFFRGCAFGVLLVAAILAQRRRRRAATGENLAAAGLGSRGVGALVVAQGASVLAGALITVLGTLGLSAPAALVAFVYGVAPAVLYVAWGALYMRLQIKEAFACVLVTYIMSAVLNGALFFMPGSVQPFAASASLLLAGLLYPLACDSVRRLASGSPASAPHRPAPSTARRSAIVQKPPLWKFALCLFAYGLALGVLQHLVDDNQGPAGELLTHGIEIALALAFLAAIYVARRPMRFAPMIIVLFAVLSGGLVLTFLGDNAFALVLLKITHSFLGIVVWMVAVDFCRHADMHSVVVVSLLFLMRSLAPLVISLVGGLPPDGFWEGATVGVVALWGLSLSTVLFVTESDLVALRLFDGVLPQGDTGKTSVVELEGRCRQLAGEGGLTAREEEVLAVLCLGKSKAYIARELGMSEATAKSHVRNIYSKLGVHSKNELQELIGL